MFSTPELIETVIVPTLNELGMSNGTNLLLGTAAQESRMGKYLVQIGGGPALGIWQVEPNTNALVLNWLMENKPDLFTTVRLIRNRTAPPANVIVSADTNKAALQYNHCYCCAIARCLYFSIASPLPAENDVEGMAHYWKIHYNSIKGKGTVEEFIANYKKYVEPYI